MYKQSSSLFKIVIVGLLVSALMMVFITTLQRHEKALLHTAMATKAAEFNARVLLIHAQWRLDDKPPLVFLSTSMESSKGEQVTYAVNKRGWPDMVLSHNACARLWHKLLEIELKVLNKPLAAIELKSTAQPDYRVCRYHLDSKQYIEYNAQTGKISNKN